MDGDGSIQIGRTKASVPTFDLHVVVNNTDARITNSLAVWWGCVLDLYRGRGARIYGSASSLVQRRANS